MPLGIPQSWAEANSLYSLILESAQNPASLRGGVGRRPRLQNPAKSGAVAARSSRSCAGSMPGCQAPRLAPRLPGFAIAGAQDAFREGSGAKHLLPTGLDVLRAGAPQALVRTSTTGPSVRPAGVPHALVRAQKPKRSTTRFLPPAAGPHASNTSQQRNLPAAGRTLQAGSASPPWVGAGGKTCLAP